VRVEQHLLSFTRVTAPALMISPLVAVQFVMREMLDPPAFIVAWADFMVGYRERFRAGVRSNNHPPTARSAHLPQHQIRDAHSIQFACANHPKLVSSSPNQQRERPTMTTTDLNALESLNYEDLSELITRAETLRAQRREEMRAKLEKDAELIGLSVSDNGVKPRKRRATKHHDAS
jgi:hypothetical protein